MEWTNPFTVMVDNGEIADAHRIAYCSVRGDPSPTSELVYSCGTDACVNPAHAMEESLGDGPGWRPAVIERVVSHPAHLELGITMAGGAPKSLFVDRETLDRYGLGDASGLLERVVFLSTPDERGWVQVVPGARRSGYGTRSVSRGWANPGGIIDGQSECPCGSNDVYTNCHGSVATGAAPVTGLRAADE